MKLNYEIERIENGYIATGNDSTKVKRFYKTIDDFIKENTADEIESLHEEHKHNDCHGQKIAFRMTLEVI